MRTDIRPRTLLRTIFALGMLALFVTPAASAATVYIGIAAAVPKAPPCSPATYTGGTGTFEFYNLPSPYRASGRWHENCNKPTACDDWVVGNFFPALTGEPQVPFSVFEHGTPVNGQCPVTCKINADEYEGVGIVETTSGGAGVDFDCRAGSSDLSFHGSLTGGTPQTGVRIDIGLPQVQTL